MLEISISKENEMGKGNMGEKTIVVGCCFCSHREGEVTLAGRWPVSEEAKLPPCSPAGRAPALLRP